MTALRHRPAVWLLGTAGLVCILLALPLSWPGFSPWPARTTTLTPADGSGQTLLLEFDHPVRLEFPVISGNLPDGAPAGLAADLSVLSPSPGPAIALPAHLDSGRLRLDLSNTRLAAGTSLRLAFHDPSGQVWFESTEHDSYVDGSRLGGDLPVGGDLAFRVIYRRSLFEVLSRGLGVALHAWRSVAAAAVVFAAAGPLVAGALRQIEGLDLAARISAAVGGGLVIPVLAGWAAAAARLRPTPVLVALAALAMAAAGLALWRRPGSPQVRIDAAAAALLAWVGLLVLLRLAFAAPLALPPHIDAVEHYAIVTDLLTPARPPLAENQVANLADQYYHYGFHGLAAWVLALAGDTAPSVLVVLGQLIQTAAVAALYFPVYAAVRDRTAALAVVVLAGVGWTMPAHASNWSRDPALLSLALLPAAAGLAIVAYRAAGRPRLVLAGAAALAAVGVTLAHSRIPFVLAALLLAMEAGRRAGAPGRSPGLVPRALGALALVGIAGAALAWRASPLQRDWVWSSMLETLKAQGSVSTLLVLCLAPLALKRHPGAALAALIWTALTVLLVLMPPNAAYPLPVLDEPMLRLVLFLPMSLLGSLGVSSLLTMSGSPTLNPALGRARRIGAACLCLGYLGWVLSRQVIAPSDCCLIAGPDDLALAQEARRLLGSTARILVPSQTQVNYSPRAVDGGAWLPGLAGLRTVLWPADAELASSTEHQRLCQAGVTHVYVGSAALSYTREELDFAGSYYSPAIVHPSASLYAVIGCGLAPP